MITSTKPIRENYYEYILFYVDYLLCISHNPNKPITDIQSTFKYRLNKVETRDFYIGAS